MKSKHFYNFYFCEYLSFVFLRNSFQPPSNVNDISVFFYIPCSQISFVMSLVRAGLLLSVLIMLHSTSAKLPYTSYVEEKRSEVLVVSHRRNHGGFTGLLKCVVTRTRRAMILMDIFERQDIIRYF